MVSNDRAFGLSISRAEMGISDDPPPVAGVHPGSAVGMSLFCPRRAMSARQMRKTGTAWLHPRLSTFPPSPPTEGDSRASRDPTGFVHSQRRQQRAASELRIDAGMILHPRFPIPHHYKYQEDSISV